MIDWLIDLFNDFGFDWWMGNNNRGAKNVRASVGSMNPFQTMGKADFTLIDPR